MSTSGGSVGQAGTPVCVANSGANSVVTATMPIVAGKTNYITSLTVTAGGATAAQLSQITLSGVLGGSQLYAFAFPAGASLAAVPLQVIFNPPLPASGVGVAITASLPAGGVGNALATVTVDGYVA